MMLKNAISLIVMLVFSTPLALFAQKSFHDFTVVDINGSVFDLAQLKGKKVLVVNTASLRLK